MFAGPQSHGETLLSRFSRILTFYISLLFFLISLLFSLPQMLPNYFESFDIMVRILLCPSALFRPVRIYRQASAPLPHRQWAILLCTWIAPCLPHCGTRSLDIPFIKEPSWTPLFFVIYYTPFRVFVFAFAFVMSSTFLTTDAHLPGLYAVRCS